MAEKALRHMYRGGIFDHVGFGLFATTTPTRNAVPHFEKMLRQSSLFYRLNRGLSAQGAAFFKRVAKKPFGTCCGSDRTQRRLLLGAGRDSEGEEGN
jgi:uncharacterized protein YyaL (SSP411 family)